MNVFEDRVARTLGIETGLAQFLNEELHSCTVHQTLVEAWGRLEVHVTNALRET